MFESLRIKIIEWIQTRLNPHVNRRHPIHILMTNVGFKPIARKHRQIYRVSLDGGRLIGVFECFIPGDIFKTCLRVCVYEKLSIKDKKLGNHTYCAASIFFHAEDKIFQFGSVYKTNFLSFEDFSKHMRSIKSHVLPRSIVFKTQQSSKKKSDVVIKA